jgi:fructose-bisphosphate aldolase class II
VSGSARKYANPTLLGYVAMGAVQKAGDAGAGVPIALCLDHRDSFELAKSCIDSGFSSVMLDGSHHPFDENAELTKPEEVEEFSPRILLNLIPASISARPGKN